jgi:hypothetical protein
MPSIWMRLLRALEPVEGCGRQEQNQRLCPICRRCCCAQQGDGRPAEESMSLLKIQPKDNLLQPECFVTLVFSISTLNLLMDAFLNLPFEDAGSRRLVKPSRFEDMCRIDPVVCPSSHDAISVQLKLKHRNLFDAKKSKTNRQEKESRQKI